MRSEDSIFLTFDDGPDPEVTPWVIDQLRKFHAKATFFCLGKQLRDHPEIVRQIVNDEHVIGNHTWSHLRGWKTGLKDYQMDIALCDEELQRLGVHTNLFRPPYGRITRQQRKKLSTKRIIMWSHMSYDFRKSLNIDHAIASMKKAEAGSVVLFHDNRQSFSNLKRILPEILRWYTSRGFKLKKIQ